MRIVRDFPEQMHPRQVIGQIDQDGNIHAEHRIQRGRRQQRVETSEPQPPVENEVPDAGYFAGIAFVWIEYGHRLPDRGGITGHTGTDHRAQRAAPPDYEFS